jgi:hypothetical protein
MKMDAGPARKNGMWPSAIRPARVARAISSVLAPYKDTSPLNAPGASAQRLPGQLAGQSLGTSIRKFKGQVKLFTASLCAFSRLTGTPGKRSQSAKTHWMAGIPLSR